MKVYDLDIILTNYPLSRNFQERLLNIVTPDFLQLSLGDLRQRPFWKMIKYMRTLRSSRLLLPLEDENGSVLLPVLKLLASVIPAQKIYLVEPNLNLQQIYRYEIGISLLNLIYASFASRIATLRANIETQKLLNKKCVTVSNSDCNSVMYLNANLWFGVKAGGSVGHISGVVNAIAQSGYAVNFISCGGRLMVNERIPYIQLTPPKYFGLPWELNYYKFHFDAVKQLKSLSTNKSYNFIYQRLSISNYSGVMLSRQLGIPLVLEYNGSEAWIARNWGRPLREQNLAEKVEEVNLKHAHLIVTISNVLRDELINRGVAPERIVTYPNCIDPEIFDPKRFSKADIEQLRRQHGIELDAVVVTFIGTFGQWHGIEVLAKAIRNLIDNYQDWIKTKKVHFLLVGDGLKMPEVRQILGEHAQGKFVTLTGLVAQHDAPLYLAASDILASPHVSNTDGSKFFGSPTKLFEYMAMEKAIIASDLDQIGDILRVKPSLTTSDSAEKNSHQSNQLALLVEPGNIEQLIMGIQQLVNDPVLCKVLGHNVRSLALEHYTWKSHVDEILNGLKQVLINRAL